MISDLQVWIVDAVEFPKHLHKVGLAVEQSTNGEPGSFPEGREPEMLQAEHALRFYEFALELLQWQFRRQDGMLNIEKAVIAGGHFS